MPAARNDRARPRRLESISQAAGKILHLDYLTAELCHQWDPNVSPDLRTDLRTDEPNRIPRRGTDASNRASDIRALAGDLIAPQQVAVALRRMTATVRTARSTGGMDVAIRPAPTTASAPLADILGIWTRLRAVAFGVLTAKPTSVPR